MPGSVDSPVSLLFSEGKWTRNESGGEGKIWGGAWMSGGRENCNWLYVSEGFKNNTKEYHNNQKAWRKGKNEPV